MEFIDAEEAARQAGADMVTQSANIHGNRIDGQETLAETPNLRVRMLTLGGGQCVPWHLHSTITDTFFCMLGPMQVETRDPHAVHRLDPGQTRAVPPGIPHRVSGIDDGPCKFMIVQGIGPYDFVPVEN